jgi:K(+)-stimulated pyrophosphate-energized sodium pump
MGDGKYDMHYVIFPLILRGIGVIASLIGNLIVRTDEQKRDAMGAMNRGFYLAAAVAVVGFATITQYYMIDPATGMVDWKPFLATVSGVVLAIALDKLTEYFTSTHSGRPRSQRRLTNWCCHQYFVGHRLRRWNQAHGQLSSSVWRFWLRC